jgi:hypothetical protein
MAPATDEYFPASPRVHPVFNPVTPENVPGGHGLAVGIPFVAQVVPAGHVIHVDLLVAPTVELYVPCSHEMGLVGPTTVSVETQYEPGGQGIQAVESDFPVAALYVPLGHFVIFPSPKIQYPPLGHIVATPFLI